MRRWEKKNMNEAIKRQELDTKAIEVVNADELKRADRRTFMFNKSGSDGKGHYMFEEFTENMEIKNRGMHL